MLWLFTSIRIKLFFGQADICVIKVNLQYTSMLFNLPKVQNPRDFDKVIIENTRQTYASHQFIWLQPTTCKNIAFLWPTANMVQLLVWLQPSFARTHSAHFYMLICFQWAVFKGRVNVFLVRKGNREKRKREDGAPGRCKCSPKSTWPSTLSSMILTFSTLNSVKQISANNKGALWGSSVL